MKKHITLKNAGITLLVFLALYFIWSMRPQKINTIMKEWDKVTRVQVIDMYGDVTEDRVLAADELARFKAIMESATFRNRFYANHRMYGNLYGIYLYKDGKMYMDESLDMRVFPSGEGYIYIGNTYRYNYDKHAEMWAFLESLDLTAG